MTSATVGLAAVDDYAASCVLEETVADSQALVDDEPSEQRPGRRAGSARLTQSSSSA